MGCRCGQRRDQIIAAVKAAAAGDVRTASATRADVARTTGEDAAAGLRRAGRGLAAAHARLRR